MELMPDVDTRLFPQLTASTHLPSVFELLIAVARLDFRSSSELEIVYVTARQLEVWPLLRLAGAVKQH